MFITYKTWFVGCRIWSVVDRILFVVGIVFLQTQLKAENGIVNAIAASIVFVGNMTNYKSNTANY